MFTAVFTLQPNRELKADEQLEVRHWLVNDKEDSTSLNQDTFVKRLSHRQDYIISASVTVNGKDVKVTPCTLKATLPPLPALTYSIVLTRQEHDNGDNVDAYLTLTPNRLLQEDEKVQVLHWLINGQKENGSENQLTLSKRLSYRKRYTITAIVSMNGQEIQVSPFLWNNIDIPVWMIVRSGNKDGEYKVICTNASNIEYSVQNWEKPIFRNSAGQDISDKFKYQISRSISPNQMNVNWEQNHLGEYILELAATVNIHPKFGHKAGTASIKQLFVMINGSMGDALVSLKISQAKKSVYHCFARNTDGSQHNGTAFAISDKYLLTNYHVAVGNPDNSMAPYTVDLRRPLELSNETSKFYAKVINSSRDADLALLELCDANGQPTEDSMSSFFRLANRATPPGTRVFSLGYPAGTTPHGHPSYTNGKVEEYINEQNCEIVLHYSNIQKGYSGGPLIAEDRDTDIVGVNFAGLRTENHYTQGINFAISAQEVRRRFPELLQARQ